MAGRDEPRSCRRAAWLGHGAGGSRRVLGDGQAQARPGTWPRERGCNMRESPREKRGEEGLSRAAVPRGSLVEAQGCGILRGLENFLPRISTACSVPLKAPPGITGQTGAPRGDVGADPVAFSCRCGSKPSSPSSAGAALAVRPGALCLGGSVATPPEPVGCQLSRFVLSPGGFGCLLS